MTMAKDRNSYAKRQREIEKKRKADKKRDRRAERTRTVGSSWDTDKSVLVLTPEQQSALGIFRKFQMTTGKMLCFSGPDLATFHDALDQLTVKGLLEGEMPRGSYSLTETGFAAMNDVA
jgi:hypothetical protein